MNAPGGEVIDLERVICRESDLEGKGTHPFTLGRGDWPLKGFVVRAGAAVHAYVNRCPHAGHPLDLVPGRFLTADGTLLLCASHGALFEKSTGLCLAGPCAGRGLTRVPVRVRLGLVMLEEGAEPEALAATLDPAPQGY
ncbi:MAG: Rieske 2Fe-2S domain-containing protein [Proteobacteria bacterium]|nr:Rieske 2Fe-2S domain-containing protein [Pseudomonadota bacterium]